MALLQRTRILPQQRLDLPDFRNIEDFVCADFKAQFKNIWTGENFVLKGFVTTGIGTNAISMQLAGSALIVGSDDGTMFIGAPSLSPATSDALTPASTNYVELSIEQDTGGADSRAFWDPTAAAGQGGEFSQIVDTFIFTKAKLNINTSNFTGGADKVPVCEVDVNGSGIITDIRDARNMFWRLGRRGQDTFTYSWASRTEPPVSQFNGADKDIDSEKAWKDAVMSRLLEIDGGTHWFEDSGVSNVGAFRNVGLSMTTAQSTDAKWSWDGSLLKLTDSNVSPLDADAVAAIRLFDTIANLILTRQDGTGGSTAFALSDGDVLWVELPDPSANTNYSGIGLTASNFRVSPRGSVPNDDTTFWLAFREGANVYLRFFGELQPGEDVEISDNINENILAAIGIASETDMPNYTSNNIVVDGTSLVAAVSALDAAAGIAGIQANQDRSLKLIEGGTWHVDVAGTNLSWSADAFVDVPEVTRVSNRILAGNITLPNANSVAYVEVNRASGPATLTVNVADIDALTPTENTVIIARRVTAGILVGRSCFLLKANEYLELDGALAEINRKLGQLKLRPHETDAFKARIDAGDITQLDSSVLSQIIGDFLLKFDGAVINFQTGVVNKADDTTPLGVNFTPFTIPASQYFWYGVSLIPGNVLADNTQEAQVQIDLAASANAVQASAPKPVISGDIKLGAIQIFNNAGSLQISETRKLGVGSGSGSGSGDASAVDTALRDRFSLNNFLFLTENIFRTDKDTKYDVSSTGAYAPAKKAFGFASIGQTMVSKNSLDSDFLDDGIDISEAELYLFWLAGFVDTAATYELSRDGGTNWQVASMERIGTTNAYRVHHTFTDEVVQQTLQSVAATGAGTALNATTAQQLSSQLVLANTSVVKALQLSMNKAAAAVGNLYVQLVKDNAGVPSLVATDVLAESDAINIGSLATGDITVNVDMPDTTLVAGTYHIVLRTDAAYKAGTMDLSWRNGAGTNGAAYNGTSYTGGASTKAAVAQGRALDLRVRVTAGTALTYIEGYGIYYDSSLGIQPSSTRKIQKFVFSGDENRTDFACNFQLDPYIVSVHDPLRGQVYIPDTAGDSALRTDGNTLKFAANTFNFPGEQIVLIVRQLEGNGVDVSQENASKIFDIQQQLVDIGDELASISDSMVVSKISVPNTTIVNRAQIADLTQDLKPRFGINRMMVQQLVSINNESGPNGETVFGVVNDFLGQVRFVGPWNVQSDTNGQRVENAVAASGYAEVTFVGTGLNILTLIDSAGRDLRASVDGGAEGANLIPSGSGVLNGRNYSQNVPINIVKGLSYGMHTVKLRVNASNVTFFGFEFLTESSTGLIRFPIGSQLYKGRRLTHSTLETSAYNSGFETGVLGTRGGRVLIYQKTDGSVAKAVMPVNASSAFGTSADHSNEEVARVHNFREFGHGRVDDFSLALSASTRFGTLDDGTTTLYVDSGTSQLINNEDAFFANGTSNFFVLTFVGTGLDILQTQSSPARDMAVTIDGVSAGTILAANMPRGTWAKVISGLPYGTHVVKFVQSAGGTGPTFQAFRAYQPKTPTLPTGAVAIGAYNILGNFANNTSATAEAISAGVIRKAALSELSTVGGSWTVNPSVGSGSSGSVAGVRLLGAAAGQTVSYTFFGTGFDLRLSTPVAVNTFTVSIDGTNPTAAGATATGFYGNWSSFVAGTGVATSNGSGSFGNGLWISGLPLGVHTVTLTQNAATSYGVEAFDIISPIHVTQLNGPHVIQNSLAVGSQSIADLRLHSKKDFKILPSTTRANGVTTSRTDSSTTYVPVVEMSVAHHAKTGMIRVSYSLPGNTGGGQAQALLFVDGKQVGRPTYMFNNSNQTMTQTQVVEVPNGARSVVVQWLVNASTVSIINDYRTLVVEDVVA